MNIKNKIAFSSLACLIILAIPGYFIQAKNNATVSKKNSIEFPFVVVNVKSYEETFQDKRDGKKYRQIKIGNQIWMAENLNYGKLVVNMEQGDNKLIEKTYYNNDSIVGKKMGALYTWEEAINYKLPDASKIVQGICPDGWHLPSDKEWDELCNTLDPSTKSNKNGWLGKNIAVVLIDSTKNKFNAKFAGNAVSNWYFYLNNMSYFWTSSKYSSASAYYRCLTKDSKQIYKGAGDIKIGMSVRCIKN